MQRFISLISFAVSIKAIISLAHLRCCVDHRFPVRLFFRPGCFCFKQTTGLTLAFA
jgi:hypothetical protein